MPGTPLWAREFHHSSCVCCAVLGFQHSHMHTSPVALHSCRAAKPAHFFLDLVSTFWLSHFPLCFTRLGWPGWSKSTRTCKHDGSSDSGVGVELHNRSQTQHDTLSSKCMSPSHNTCHAFCDECYTMAPCICSLCHMPCPQGDSVSHTMQWYIVTQWLWVLTRPKRVEKPSRHSQLSVNDQAKKCVRRTPSATALQRTARMQAHISARAPVRFWYLMLH